MDQGVEAEGEHEMNGGSSMEVLGIYPKELKTYGHIKICTQMLEQLYS